jgi:hypothetical protein
VSKIRGARRGGIYSRATSIRPNLPPATASRWKQCRTTCLRNPFTHSCHSPTPFGCTMASINSLICWDKLGAPLKRWNVACKARFAVLRQLQCVRHMHTTHRVRVQHHAQMATQWQLFSHEEKLCTHSRPCRVDLAAVVHLARMIDEPVHEHCVCHAATHTFSTIEPARKPVAATDTYMAASCSFLPWSWRPTRVEAP